MVIWLQHNAFQKELKSLRKTACSIDDDIEKVKRLLVAHFYDEQNKGNIIKPGKIHRVTIDNDVTSRELWKVEVVTSGLKPSLWPRMWFMIDGETIASLAIASHKDNYDNNAMDKIAINRYRDMVDL